MDELVKKIRERRDETHKHLHDHYDCDQIGPNYENIWDVLDALVADALRLVAEGQERMAPTGKAPTIEELEEILSAGEAPPIDILPNGELVTRAQVDLRALADRLEADDDENT